MNKNLYSISYMLFMAGASGLFLTAFYVVLDVWKVVMPFQPLVWMGINAILVFIFAAWYVCTNVIHIYYNKLLTNKYFNQYTRDQNIFKYIGDTYII